jgi:uncharacterized repeat protein (TIGR01451 family)
MKKWMACTISVSLALLTLSFAGWELTTRSAQAKGSEPMLSRAEQNTPNGTIIDSEITTNTVWTKAGSPYTITTMVIVSGGITLTVDSGVQVIAEPDATLYVAGNLVAKGTQAERILFTSSSKKPGAWSGILAANLLYPASVTLQYATVEYGGGQNQSGNLDSFIADTSVSHCIFQHSLTNGLAHTMGSGSLQVSDTAFLNNTEDAVYIDETGSSDPILSGLTASGNGRNAVVYHAVTFQGVTTLENMGLPTIMESGFTVDDTASLTIQPGVVLEDDANAAIYGPLTAKGTVAQPILITGVDKKPGSWEGLELYGNQGKPVTATFDHVTIEYGGMYTNTMPGNLKVEDAVVTVTNSILRNSAFNGITSNGGYVETQPSLTLDNVQFTGNQASAVYCWAENCNIKAHDLSASGNGHNTITYDTNLSGPVVWRKAGIDYLVQNQVVVDASAVLSIDPGVKVQFDKSASLEVAGALFADGTLTQPITFTASSSQAGWWDGISLGKVSSGVLDLYYCDIGYASVNLTLDNNSASIRNCRIHDSSETGINNIETSQPLIRYNRFEGNPTAVFQSEAAELDLDARYNWWGDASGPKATTNPAGKGDPISDRVTFEPWLTSTAQTKQTGGVNVTLLGPLTFSPGSTQYYAATYSNDSAQTVNDAVLRLALPVNAEYLDNTGGGILYPEIQQVFWKLGSLAPGERGTVAVRVRFDWGVPVGLHDTVVSQISGSDMSQPPFDVSDYINYVPNPIVSRVDVSSAQVKIDRGLYPDLDQLFTQAEGKGYVFGKAQTLTYFLGQVQTEYILLKFKPGFSTLVLWRDTNGIMAQAIDGSSVSIGNTSENMSYSLQTGEWKKTSGVGVMGIQATNGMSWTECMKNCIEEKLPSYVVSKYIKGVSVAATMVSCYQAAKGDQDQYLDCAGIIGGVVPGWDEGVELGKCNYDCQKCKQNGKECDDDNCHCCKTDKHRCDSGDWLYGFFGLDVIKKTQCYEGKYLAEVVESTCAWCSKCVQDGDPHCESKNSQTEMMQSFSQTATSQIQLSAVPDATVSSGAGKCPKCEEAKDPNELYGPQGDLLPGQVVTYTITYENIGTGEAYGVFIDDSLSPYFDLSTLKVVSGSASLSAATQSLYFEVGDLAAKGEAGSSGSVAYAVRLKSGLASGTIIQNQAVVFFPSVPEQTPTNPAINSIQPVRADPRSLQTTGIHPVSFKLTGKDAGGLPLTFTVAEGPFYGSLSGTAPHLTYTARAGFSGRDRLVFTASNGNAASLPAEVAINVLPDPNDTTAPQVEWASPAAASVVTVAGDPMPGLDGTIYEPMIQAQFSEALDQTTVNSKNVKVSRGGSVVNASIRYDPVTYQMVVFIEEAPRGTATYTVVIGTGVKDLVGNHLAAVYPWSFQVISTGSAGYTVFLPRVVR